VSQCDWHPGVERDVLAARARLFADIRAFFAEREVLEVDTPLLTAAGSTDPAATAIQAGSRGSAPGRLITSPEFAMKRLLAAGSGPIYQLGHVFRADETGRHHNPEFCMLEWYRPRWSQEALMDELRDLLAAVGVPAECTRQRYADAFRAECGLHPLHADTATLREYARKRGLAPADAPHDETPGARTFWLDLLMGVAVAPGLGPARPVFITDYPAAQAVLTATAGDGEGARRFELYWRGVELANGGEELTEPHALRARLRSLGDPAPRLSAAAEALPPCAGVALGVDRLLMLTLGRDRIEDVLPFAGDRA